MPPKRGIAFLIVILILIVIGLIAGVLYYFALKTQQNVPNMNTKSVRVEERKSASSYSKIIGPTIFKGMVPLMIAKGGFSQKVISVKSGSSLVLINATADSSTTAVTDAAGKKLDTVILPVGKASAPILQDKVGTFQFKDKKGNIAIVVLLP